jgi:hypothetical protein
VNQFHAAGGLAVVIRDLLGAGLLHADIRCVHGGDLHAQAREPWLDGTTLRWRDPPDASLDPGVLRSSASPFDSEGGLRRLQGNLGRANVAWSDIGSRSMSASHQPFGFERGQRVPQRSPADIEGLEQVPLRRQTPVGRPASLGNLLPDKVCHIFAFGLNSHKIILYKVIFYTLLRESSGLR